MNGEARLASLTHGFAFLVAVCAAITTTILGSIALLWIVAAALDGRWQGVLAFAALSALVAAQIWLFFAALKRRDAGRVSLGTIYLAGSSLPALAFMYAASL